MSVSQGAPPRRGAVRRAWGWVATPLRPFGLILGALFVAVILANAWIGPRQASPPDPDFRPGSYVVTDQQPTSLHQAPGAASTRVAGLEPSKTGQYVVWGDDNGQLRWAELTPTDEAALKDWRADPAGSESPDPRTYVQRAAYPGTALALLALSGIVGGQRPRKGTRWYWFWLQFSPLWLGAAWYAYRERISPLPEDRQPMRRGADGLATLILLWLGVWGGFGLLSGL